jgi:hypothetical protein
MREAVYDHDHDHDSRRGEEDPADALGKERSARTPGSPGKDEEREAGECPIIPRIDGSHR